ncbi:MAG: glutamate 5-kinase [Candidatus Omnitrophica bacterium]|nr:glutamate 5-kinase [Candidatus Omnitrophota bacterium]
MKESGKAYNRVVVKIGSSLFCSETDGLNRGLLKSLVLEVNSLIDSGKEVIIVSSGAIALGMSRLKLSSRPKELPYLQAAAAIGQNILMENYSSLFQEQKINCAQVLLTWDDFNDRERYLNAKNTLQTLLKLKTVPIINENDTVSTDEIKFGDNDQLSARVASLVSADLLVILSDVDGLLDQEQKLVKVVAQINSQIRQLACPTQKKTCVGGMITKIDAAKIAVDSGIVCVIANGKRSGVICETAEDPLSQGMWTVFLPKQGFLAERKRWIAFGSKPKGKIIIDEGAKNALQNKKSLLSVGVISACGNFNPGDVVAILDKNGFEVARGKSSISCKHLEKVKGERFEKEIVHRDDLVLI